MKRLFVLAISLGALVNLSGCTYWKYLTTDRTPEDDGFTSRSIFARNSDDKQTTKPATAEQVDK